MANPKKRRTVSDKGKRRSHHALKKIVLSVCEKCGKPVKSHHACSSCGFYNGKNVLEKKAVSGGSEKLKKDTTKSAPKKKAEKEKESKDSKES